MKKGEIYEGRVEKTEFPNKGIVMVEDRRVAVKNALAGQTIRFRLKKVRKGVGEGQLLEVLKPAANEITPACPHFASCGGCTWQNLSYEDQRLSSSAGSPVSVSAATGSSAFLLPQAVMPASARLSKMILLIILNFFIIVFSPHFPIYLPV